MSEAIRLGALRWLQARALPLQSVLIDEPRQASATFKQQGAIPPLFFDAEGALVSRRIGELSVILDQKLQQSRNELLRCSFETRP
jgi:hypothetical protein